jgi:hypothetical protein
MTVSIPVVFDLFRPNLRCNFPSTLLARNLLMNKSIYIDYNLYLK